MSISGIVTDGIGPGGSVLFLLTGGLGAGPEPPPPPALPNPLFTWKPRRPGHWPSPVITPGSSILYSVDFTNFLPVGATLDDVEVTIDLHPLSNPGAPDATPSIRLNGDAFLQVGDKIASQLFSFGVDGADYVLSFHVTLTDAEIAPYQVWVSVREFI